MKAWTHRVIDVEQMMREALETFAYRTGWKFTVSLEERKQKHKSIYAQECYTKKAVTSRSLMPPGALTQRSQLQGHKAPRRAGEPLTTVPRSTTRERQQIREAWATVSVAGQRATYPHRP